MTSTDEQVYLVVCPHVWGRGVTLAEAKANARKHGGSLQRHVSLLLPPGAVRPWVDDMGSARWEWAADADRGGKPVEVERRGMRR